MSGEYKSCIIYQAGINLKYFKEGIPINTDLTGKTALVCGASKGIGKATACEMANLNANIVLLARSGDDLKNIVKNLPGTGKHSFITADVSDRDKLKEKIKEVLKNYGTIHVMVNNTGGPKGGPITEAQEDEFLQAFQNHVLVNSMLTKLLLPGMKEAGYGRIINIISTSVKIPIPNLGVSNTIRAAVANWAKTLSGEVAKFGITVNNVLPGYTDTERLHTLMDGAASKAGKSKDEIAETWKSTIPAGRFGNPEEIASVAAFLATPAASYINGINLPVDGGRTGSL